MCLGLRGEPLVQWRAFFAPFCALVAVTAATGVAPLGRVHRLRIVICPSRVLRRRATAACRTAATAAATAAIAAGWG